MKRKDGDLVGLCRDAQALLTEHTGRDGEFVPNALRLLLDYLTSGDDIVWPERDHIVETDHHDTSAFVEGPPGGHMLEG